MPKTEFTRAELESYFAGNIEIPMKKEAIEAADNIRIHADGLYPAKIIDDARPHEDNEAKEYRKKIWKPKTKPTFSKVLTSLSKIRRSSDWSVLYPSEPFARIPDGETLEDYCESNFPNFGSVTNWTFGVLLREYLIDPNAVVLVLPFKDLDTDTEFVQPYPHIIPVNHVIEYIQDDFCIVQNPLAAYYKDDKGGYVAGKSFYLATTESIFRFDQTKRDKFELVWQYDHMTGILPAEKIRAVLKKSIGSDFLFESRIEPMLSELDEAAREYSDLQAVKVMHMYPERWEIATVECPTCNGTTKITTENGPITCTDCGGSGDAPSPFSRLLVRRAGPGEVATPIPPAGFVEKDAAIIDKMEKSVATHLYDALAAINMEFLNKVPLAESGISKEVDRDETNNFVHSVGEDLVRVMDWFYLIAAAWRYSLQYPNEFEAMLPTISVPEHFDIFSTAFIEKELANAKEKKFNPVLISYMEREYASKKFATSETDVLTELEIVLDHDPFQSLTEDEKMMRLTNKGIRQADYIISCNIAAFVRRAMRENENFPDLSYAEQNEILTGYAEEIITSNQSSIKPPGDTGLDPAGNPIDPNKPIPAPVE